MFVDALSCKAEQAWIVRNKSVQRITAAKLHHYQGWKTLWQSTA